MEMYCYIDDLLSHIMQILSHFLVFCLPFNKHWWKLDLKCIFPVLPFSLYLFKVESFILDQEDLDNPIMKTASELLLSSATDGVDLRTVDPETQARLEALLEAAGMTALSELNSA